MSGCAPIRLRLTSGATRLHFVSVFVRLRRDESAWQASDELRRASNKGTLRAFRNADRFPNFKIFRRPGRSLTTSRLRSIAAIGSDFSPDPLTVRSSLFTCLPYG